MDQKTLLLAGLGLLAFMVFKNRAAAAAKPANDNNKPLMPAGAADVASVVGEIFQNKPLLVAATNNELGPIPGAASHIVMSVQGIAR